MEPMYTAHVWGRTNASRSSPCTKLERLARSLPDARDIADELTRKGVALSLGGSVYDPNDPVGRLLFNVLGMVAEFSVISTRRSDVPKVGAPA